MNNYALILIIVTYLGILFYIAFLGEKYGKSRVGK